MTGVPCSKVVCPVLKMVDAQGVSSKQSRWRCRSSEGTWIASPWLVFRVQKWCVLYWKWWMLRVSAVSRTGEGADQVKERVCGNRRITIFDLIMCWKFNLGHLAAFWKTMRTCIWFHHIYALLIGWGAEEISVYQDPQERLETTFWLIFPNFSIVLKGWWFNRYHHD